VPHPLKENDRLRPCRESKLQKISNRNLKEKGGWDLLRC
jgi:hypothetical protein